MSLAGKTLFITGASRGIGLAIGLRAARDGANIVIAAKTAEPHKKLPGTIYSAAEEIEKAGGQALPLVVDVREPDSVQRRGRRRGGALRRHRHLRQQRLAPSSSPARSHTDIRRYDLMHQVNARGTFVTSPRLPPAPAEGAPNPHVLMLSPPLDMSPRWFAGHVAYTMAKYGMSMCVLGMAEEFKDDGIAFNALWPRTGIATAAIEFALAGEEGMRHCRTPEIMADAAYAIFNKPARAMHRQLLHRRRACSTPKASATSTSTASIRPRPDAGLLRAGKRGPAAGREFGGEGVDPGLAHCG